MRLKISFSDAHKKKFGQGADKQKDTKKDNMYKIEA